ncbi:MAG: VOC family protein [Alphaproteobacteria bacterium]
MWKKLKDNQFVITVLVLMILNLVGTTHSAISGEGEVIMEKVTGIGGVFFRAQDPGLVAGWYKDNLGIDLVPKDYDTKPWYQEAGPTIFAPFDAATEYFGSPDQQWMINFRVTDLDAMVAQLRANGNEVEVDPETYPNGRFARVYDPEGTPIQLWEPAGDE